MKQSIFLIAVLVFILTACNSHTNYNNELVRADSLMASQPDSALHILEDFPLQQLTTQADKAYYALLLTQARDKNYIIQTNDSLILTAVRYYDSNNDATKQAYAYFYWGNTFRDKNEYPAAVDKYLTALSHTTPSGDGELCSLIYNNLAYLYYIQDLNAEAEIIYRQLEKLALQQADTISLCYSLIQLGMIDYEKGKEYYPKAEQQILQALSIGKIFSNSAVLSPIYSSLSNLYYSTSDTTKLLQYSRLNYLSGRDTTHCYSTFLHLGGAYFLNSQYDSASIFLQKILTVDKYYDTKADACRLLSKIAQFKGDIAASALMERKRAEYLDSAKKNRQGTTTLKTIITHERDNNKTIQEHYLHIILAISTAFFILCVLGILYIWKKKKQLNVARREWETKLQDKLQTQEKVNLLAPKEQVHATSEYKTCAVYIKVKQIAKKLIKVETKENLSEEEWSQFITLTNEGWNGIITYLNDNYNLSTEEIQICCLSLAEIPVKHMGHFIEIQSRSTIQEKSKIILLKIGAPKMLELKNALPLLATQLENSK